MWPWSEDSACAWYLSHCCEEKQRQHGKAPINTFPDAHFHCWDLIFLHFSQPNACGLTGGSIPLHQALFQEQHEVPRAVTTQGQEQGQGVCQPHSSHRAQHLPRAGGMRSAEFKGAGDKAAHGSSHPCPHCSSTVTGAGLGCTGFPSQQWEFPTGDAEAGKSVLKSSQAFSGCASVFEREKEYDGKGAGEVRSSSVH